MKHSTLRVLTLISCVAVGGGCDADKPADTKAGAAGEVKAGVAVDAKAAADAKAGADAAGVVEAPAVTAGAAAVVDGVVALRPVVEVEAALGKPVVLATADLDLQAVVELVIAGKVATAAELELLLNAPGEASHKVDLDVDGKLDYLQVVEVRAEGGVSFELRAIASSKLDASLAVLVASIVTARAEAGGKLEVAASYGAAVKGGADFKLERAGKAELKGNVAVVADASAGAFLGWALTVGRPVYVSTHVSAADITVAADGAVQFGVDATARLTAAQLAALRGALKVEVAVVGKPQGKLDVDVDAGAKHGAKAGAKAESSASVGGSAKAGGSVGTGAKAGASVGSGVKAGASVGVSLGGGVSVGGKSKGGGGIKIGK